jgi:hypothetical protein
VQLVPDNAINFVHLLVLCFAVNDDAVANCETSCRADGNCSGLDHGYSSGEALTLNTRVTHHRAPRLDQLTDDVDRLALSLKFRSNAANRIQKPVAKASGLGALYRRAAVVVNVQSVPKVKSASGDSNDLVDFFIGPVLGD